MQCCAPMCNMRVHNTTRGACYCSAATRCSTGAYRCKSCIWVCGAVRPLCAVQPLCGAPAIRSPRTARSREGSSHQSQRCQLIHAADWAHVTRMSATYSGVLPVSELPRPARGGEGSSHQRCLLLFCCCRLLSELLSHH